MIEARMQGTTVDIGYVLAKKYWGQDYMSEAARAIVDWALGLDEIYRVSAVCDIDNIGSARVMEKAGMQREGRLRRYMIHPHLSAEPRDVYMYAKVKEVSPWRCSPPSGSAAGRPARPAPRA